jgi:hypothetical protein
MMIFDCPIAVTRPYLELPEVSRRFRRIFSFFPAAALSAYLPGATPEPMCWPLPYRDVHATRWANEDRKFITAFVSNKEPACPGPELYSERIRAIRHFAKTGEIEFYGPGWKAPRFPRRRFQWKWCFDRKFKAAWRGTAPSKCEALSRYRFAVCFENMVLDGWITEKLFDCLHAGTIPVYLGAPDIAAHVPPGAFVDFRQFGSYDALGRHLRSLSPAAVRKLREAGRDFLRSAAFEPFSTDAFTARFREICARGAAAAAP